MKKKIIVITGPTAVGKSNLAFSLAKFLNTQIISADSRQVYKYMNIGTAKPEQSMLNSVKHHLIDIIEPDSFYSAADFVHHSEQVINSLNTVPVICGGTGFYIRSLTDWSLNMPSDKNVKQKVLTELNEYGLKELYQKICNFDEEEAMNLNPNDKNRILRNLEIIYITNKKVSELKKNFVESKKKFKYLKLCIMQNRQKIYDKINNRVDFMIKNGLVDETNQLLKKGYSPTSPGLNTIGYKEIVSFLCNNISFNDAVYKIKLNTRHYAKRQITWFKKEKNIVFSDYNFEFIKNICSRFLNS